MSLIIHQDTVSDALWEILIKLMTLESLKNFRLVGGTSLSLLLGHRMSVDIDMFTDSDYGSVDFLAILNELKQEFKGLDHNEWTNDTIGNSCFIGFSKDRTVKLDLFYTDRLVFPVINHGDIRLSSLEETTAMKLDVIASGGRKKDFWDIHALFEQFDLAKMLETYSTRYPDNFSKNELIESLIHFEDAEADPDPICLLGKYWELIKLDIEEAVSEFRRLESPTNTNT